MKVLRPTGLVLASALAAALLLCPLAAAAGGERRGSHGLRHHDPETRLARLTQEIDLSPEQQELLRPILEQQAVTFRAFKQRRDAGESRADLRAEMRAQRDSNSEEIEAVLNDEQIAEYRSLRERREHKLRKRFNEYPERDAGASEPAI